MNVRKVSVDFIVLACESTSKQVMWVKLSTLYTQKFNFGSCSSEAQYLRDKKMERSRIAVGRLKNGVG